MFFSILKIDFLVCKLFWIDKQTTLHRQLAPKCTRLSNFGDNIFLHQRFDYWYHCSPSNDSPIHVI